MSTENKSFFDSNTITALIVTFIIFFGWQEYLKYKYPKADSKVAADIAKTDDIGSKLGLKTTHTKTVAKSDLQALVEGAVAPENVAVETFKVDNEFWSFDLSSKGMALSNVVIKKINKVAKKPYTYKHTESFFPTKVDGKILNFSLSKVNDNEFIGRAKIFQKGVLVKKIKINSEKYLIDVNLSFQGELPKEYSVHHELLSNIQDPKKAVFFLPAFERNELYVKTIDDYERKILNTKEVTEAPELYNSTKLTALGDHYFTTAFLNEKGLLPFVSYKQDKNKVNVDIAHQFSPKIALKEINYNLFIGPKRIDLMETISSDLVSSIDFTYLGFIARPIIKTLNFLYGILGNYGLAVIILTFLIRLLILPLAVSSFRSMKKMQTIQPRLKAIKEKYKADPQKVNQMTMQLMKEEKVNPLGGCLPMFLQLPIFFAFYRGLSESVDLYQAPFFLWIDDLSKMDPYFILPVLSMAGMVIQQLVTPSTMDKMQKKMMMVMPVVFGALFVTLPSALTLYMAVSTWFGLGQHYIFLRERT